MRVLNWCMLGVTILLLMCEVAISQLCKSLITLVDGFHTLFILMHLALPLPLPQNASTIKASPSSLEPSASPPAASSSLAALPASLSAESSIEPLAGTQRISTQPNHEKPSLINTHQHFSPKISPAALNCGLSYPNSRVQVVRVFISTLLLASLCISYFMEIIHFFLEPHPVHQPQLAVVVGAVCTLYKMLVFGLSLQHKETRFGRQQRESESSLPVNQKVLADEQSIGQEEFKDVSPSQVESAMDNVLHSGALVLCNPVTSSIPDTDSKSPLQQPEVHLHECKVVNSAEGVKPWKCESDIRDFIESPEHNTSTGHRESQNVSKTSAVCKSLPHTERPIPSSHWPISLLSLIFVSQGLFTSLLALIHSLVMLLIPPEVLNSSGACSLLVYLDPGLSLLAVIMLIGTTMPQLYRYGLLLHQATPPHICVSDLGRRIASVPGVQAVHDLHIWQLTESLLVASVHVHCYAGFPAHRCAEVMSGVTNVLQSVGVSCCTVQPEFDSSLVSEGGASPVIHREDPSPPPRLACSLSCGKACARSMCCSPPDEESWGLLAPPSGETKEEPQTLVIENTFL
ncbi:uncharacterized protein LOC115791053 isoform X2 [Archocentrus centrarchus]|nr:uncharacterized protein LOC115791053 isoform X2 [Archocentrus centrarchus]